MVVDVYQDTACSASFNINKLFIEDNVLNFSAKYKLPMSCGGGIGIGAFVEIPKSLDKIKVELLPESKSFLEKNIDRKPVLYLYPEDETLVKVRFQHPEYLTTTYPKYKDGWEVRAKSNGDLMDMDGKYYYALYWEEEDKKLEKFDEGFYVDADGAIEFLEEKLEIIGLNERDSNEFIMYWLPILENNEKSLVYFELTEEKENSNKLIIEPKPDLMLRVTMHVKKVSDWGNIREQKLPQFKRDGFVAVEWGGLVY